MANINIEEASKIIDAFLAKDFSRKDIKLTKHFEESTLKDRTIKGTNINKNIDSIFKIIKTSQKDALENSSSSDVLVQKYKNRKRIILITREIKLIISIDTFIKTGKLVIITQLTNDMKIGRGVTKRKRDIVRYNHKDRNGWRNEIRRGIYA